MRWRNGYGYRVGVFISFTILSPLTPPPLPWLGRATLPNPQKTRVPRPRDQIDFPKLKGRMPCSGVGDAAALSIHTRENNTLKAGVQILK